MGTCKSVCVKPVISPQDNTLLTNQNEELVVGKKDNGEVQKEIEVEKNLEILQVDEVQVPADNQGTVIVENYPDGTQYKGFKNGKNKEGEGVLYFATGLIAYKGNWLNNLYDG